MSEVMTLQSNTQKDFCREFQTEKAEWINTLATYSIMFRICLLLEIVLMFLFFLLLKIKLSVLNRWPGILLYGTITNSIAFEIYLLSDCYRGNSGPQPLDHMRKKPREELDSKEILFLWHLEWDKTFLHFNKCIL